MISHVYLPSNFPSAMLHPFISSQSIPHAPRPFSKESSQPGNSNRNTNPYPQENFKPLHIPTPLLKPAIPRPRLTRRCHTHRRTLSPTLLRRGPRLRTIRIRVLPIIIRSIPEWNITGNVAINGRWDERVDVGREQRFHKVVDGGGTGEVCERGAGLVAECTHAFEERGGGADVFGAGRAI